MTMTDDIQELLKLKGVTSSEPAAAMTIPEDRDAVILTLTQARFDKYLTYSGHNQDRAFRLYMWNAQIGEAFHIPIQSVEVGLRNRISNGLTAQFGEPWWKAPKFLAIADDERRADLRQVEERIQHRKLPLCTDQIVAGLSFGFWSGMLQPKYNPPIWGAQLRVAFPNLPAGRSRKSVATHATKTGFLRNRIWHHEPIFTRDLSTDFKTVMDLLSWICPATEAWVRKHSRVQELLRQKP